MKDSVPQTAPKTPLEESLIALIKRHGPIRVSDYMADALGHPQHGYYMTQGAFGAQGDFTTAPEISQVFGELVGAWIVNAWEEIGSPSLFNLIELGPGRGTLMADLLRIAAIRPDFLKAVRVYLIETSGRQRYEQQKQFRNSGITITWATDMYDVPAAPTLIVANEFFDCLPRRQFVRTTQKDEPSWRERLIGLSDGGGADMLQFVLSPELHDTPTGAPNGAKPEDIFETSEEARKVVHHIAERFRTHKGRALIIDYGHAQAGFGDTLQAVQNHQFCPPLHQPGLVDVTAHVDFAALSSAAKEANLSVAGPEIQARVLARLGLAARAQILAAKLSGEQAQSLESGIRRLVHPEEMGTLFKVICLSSEGLPVPPGFMD